MANPKHLAVLDQGVTAWNDWYDEAYGADLSCADLNLRDLTGINFSYVNLTFARLVGATLTDAKLHKTRLNHAELIGAKMWRAYMRKAILDCADLSGASMVGAHLSRASIRDANLCGIEAYEAVFLEADIFNSNLSSAKLCRSDFRFAQVLNCNLKQADLSESSLRNADFTDSDLEGASLEFCIANRTKFINARLSTCRVYGANFWDIDTTGASQRDLRVDPYGGGSRNVIIKADGHQERPLPVISVDDLEIAHFIYSVATNSGFKKIIEKMTSKLVLILGRFSAASMQDLLAIKDELSALNLIPVIFNFDGPLSRDSMETVSTIAHLCKFVVANLTEARSVLQELQHIIPNLPSVPVIPIIAASHPLPGMLDHLRNFRNLLPLETYRDTKHLRELVRGRFLLNANSYLRVTNVGQ